MGDSRMNYEKNAKIALAEYLIVKECPNISFFKCILIAFVYLNCDFTNRSNTSLVSLYFEKLSTIYQSQKNDLILYFDSLSILEDTHAITIVDYRLTISKEFTFGYSLSENQINILRELEKVSDDVFYGMVIENV